MEFSKVLIQLRKQKGLSQEALAEKIGVSRQAISKYENSESYPDLPKLIALSNFFEVSLDELCGKKLKENNQNISKKEHKLIKILLCLCLLVGGFTLGIFSSNFVFKNHASIPENVEIEGVSFNYEGDKIRTNFMCNVTNENYKYTIVFNSISNNEIRKEELECEYGVCSAKLNVNKNYTYNVTMLIENGNESKSIPIATNFSSFSNYITWTPIQK